MTNLSSWKMRGKCSSSGSLCIWTVEAMLFSMTQTRNPNQGIDLNSWFIDSNDVPLPDFVPPAFPNDYHLNRLGTSMTRGLLSAASRMNLEIAIAVLPLISPSDFPHWT